MCFKTLGGLKQFLLALHCHPQLRFPQSGCLMAQEGTPVPACASVCRWFALISAVKGNKGFSFGEENIPPGNVSLPMENIDWVRCQSLQLLRCLSRPPFSKTEENIIRLSTFSCISGQTAVTLFSSHRLKLKRRSHFSQTALRIVKVAAAPHHVIAILLKLSITIASWRSCSVYLIIATCTHTQFLRAGVRAIPLKSTF